MDAKNYSNIREIPYHGEMIVIGKHDGGWYWQIDDSIAPHGPHKTLQSAIDSAKDSINA